VVDQLRAVAVAVTLGICLTLPAGTRASESAQLFASFNPDVSNASTTISFGLSIAGSSGVPSPLRSVDLQLPANIGLGRLTLGTAICEPAELYEEGPEGCPANSRVGYGTALAEVPYGPEVVQEQASVYAYRGNTEHERITILFFTEASAPVSADLVFPAQIVEDRPPYSESINTEVPLVPSLPGGPDVSVVRFQSTFGPKNLVYEREVNGELVSYKPRGVTVPSTCPRGGFPFAAELSFEDGSHVTARSTAPCPRGRLRAMHDHKPRVRRGRPRRGPSSSSTSPAESR
jgi:hypothetical protein